MFNAHSRSRWLSAACVPLLAGGVAALTTHRPWTSPVVASPVPVPPAPKPATAPASKATLAASTPSSSGASRKAVASPAVAFRKQTVRGVPMNIVQIDPRRPEVRLAVATAGNGIGYRDDWSRMIERTGPAAAITGTYFCTTTSLPVGLIRVGGQNIYRGGIGTALAFTPGKGAEIRTCKPGIGYDWTGYEMVLRAGPRLVTDGKRTLFPEAEGFKDPAIYARKARTAVAITKSGKLLFVAVPRPVLLRTLADALRDLGAKDAMCLDGGASTGLYFGGKTQVKPARPLTNLLVVYDALARYERAVGRLNPTGPRVAQSGPGAS